MAAAGVELALDLTQHAVIGLPDALKKYSQFRRCFNQLLKLAIQRQPDFIICVDFSGFNRRFAHAVKRYVRARLSWFKNWNPAIVQYVSPQVWASRPGRAYQLAKDIDLLLSIFPFEKDWYARRVSSLRVEFVGHPLVDRHAGAEREIWNLKCQGARRSPTHSPSSPTVLLLPGSRIAELRRHLPLLIRALSIMRGEIPGLRARIVLPGEFLAKPTRTLALPSDLEVQSGGLAKALAEADLALAKSGTITLECACFGVPAVVFYKTSWPTYLAARLVARVNHIAMPNLLANERVFPEFIQGAATPENIARTGLELLRDQTRRSRTKTRLAEIAASLGEPGAAARAARAILKLRPR
jgi:lipid-A-disaccharide synthase